MPVKITFPDSTTLPDMTWPTRGGIPNAGDMLELAMPVPNSVDVYDPNKRFWVVVRQRLWHLDGTISLACEVR